MSYIRPSQQQIYDMTKQDLFLRFPKLDPTLQTSMAEAIVGVITAGLNGNYNFIQYLSEQVFPNTASVESLDQWGTVVGLYRLPAEKGSGVCEFSGLVGGTIPTGAELATTGGNLYTVDTGFILSGTTATANVTAEEFGVDGNLSIGDVLSFNTSYAGIESDVIVYEDFSGGRDRETDDEYRTRVLERFQAPGKGGTENNYAAWIKEAVQATRVWIRSYENSFLYGETTDPGYVSGYFVIDDVYTNGIPIAADVAAVDEYVDLLKPIGTFFNAKAPVAGTVDITVNITPYSLEISESVAAALDQAILEHGSPGGTIRVSDINNALASVTSVNSYDLTYPTANVTLAGGVLHVPGTYNIGTL